MSTAILVMAAGASRRMGRPKQLLPFGATTLLRHAVEVALGSRAAEVTVVLGSDEAAMRPELSGLPVRLVSNPNWDTGMGSTIQAGVQAIQSTPEILSVILTVADSPGLTAETYNRIIAAHLASGLSIVASQYSGTSGVPVLFGREFFPALLTLAADQGCKELIRQNAAKAMRLLCPEAASDIDTPEDYARLDYPVQKMLR